MGDWDVGVGEVGLRGGNRRCGRWTQMGDWDVGVGEVGIGGGS
jgi:hypothetical protein